jgi:transposase
MQPRQRASKLNQPKIVKYVRACAMVRLKSKSQGRHVHSLQDMTTEIARRFGTSANRSTVYRFICALGLELVWRRS